MNKSEYLGYNIIEADDPKDYRPLNENWATTEEFAEDVDKTIKGLQDDVSAAKSAASGAQSTADEAKTAATAAHTVANEAQTAAETAQNAANSAMSKSGGQFTGRAYAQNTTDEAAQLRNILIADKKPDSLPTGVICFVRE